MASENYRDADRSKRPIYLKIIEQIKQRVAVGDWTEGQAIPSIRQFAADLQVSVITVKRAFLELARGLGPRAGNAPAGTGT